MWTGKWTKELDRMYERYLFIFNVEPDCDTDADLDDVSYNAFVSAIARSIVTHKKISL